MLPRMNPQVGSGQQPQSWLLPVLIAVLAGGAGSPLPVDAGIRIAVVIVIVLVLVRGSLRRVIV